MKVHTETLRPQALKQTELKRDQKLNREKRNSSLNKF